VERPAWLNTVLADLDRYDIADRFRAIMATEKMFDDPRHIGWLADACRRQLVESHPMVRLAPENAHFGYIFARGHLNPRKFVNAVEVPNAQACALCGMDRGGSVEHLVERCIHPDLTGLKAAVLDRLNNIVVESPDSAPEEPLEMTDLERYLLNPYDEDVIEWGTKSRVTHLATLANACKSIWQLHASCRKRRLKDAARGALAVAAQVAVAAPAAAADAPAQPNAPAARPVSPRRALRMLNVIVLIVKLLFYLLFIIPCFFPVPACLIMH
jgi:hypothetical protein